MFQIAFYTVVQNHFGNDILCHNKTVLDGLNILVSVSIPQKFLVPYRNYHIDLKKLVSLILQTVRSHLIRLSNFDQFRSSVALVLNLMHLLGPAHEKGDV